MATGVKKKELWRIEENSTRNNDVWSTKEWYICINMPWATEKRICRKKRNSIGICNTRLWMIIATITNKNQEEPWEEYPGITTGLL